MDKKVKVVCVEDEPGVVDLIQLIFSRRGWEVLGALSGPEGLDLIRQQRPDLVLLDLMLPGISGWVVYQHLKADEATRDIPVIVVTAKVDGIDEVLAKYIAKVDDYVKKPFSPQELLDSVDRVLAQKSQNP
jgi:DNA-binding response OmpR family regulator